MLSWGLTVLPGDLTSALTTYIEPVVARPFLLQSTTTTSIQSNRNHHSHRRSSLYPPQTPIRKHLHRKTTPPTCSSGSSSRRSRATRTASSRSRDTTTSGGGTTTRRTIATSISNSLIDFRIQLIQPTILSFNIPAVQIAHAALVFRHRAVSLPGGSFRITG